MNYRKVIVFGAHPDDEIRMAGTIALFAARGVEVVVVTFTDVCEGYPSADMRERIVEMRSKEMDECDAVLGVKRRYKLGIPDMGLVNDKETFKRVIEVIRRERPDAIFTHGPDERHRDHRAVAEIVPEAAWQAGEPVSAELGEPWRTRHVFYYRGVEGRPPDIVCDVSDFEHKRYEALATQVSQHTLFGKTREEFLEEAERVREAVRKGAKFTENFWIVPNFPISGFPDA